jgi:hypothetical protein
MRIAATVVVVFVMGGSSCTDAVCGDGVVQDGETNDTCCADAGCVSGTCDGTRCVLPYESSCPAPGTCADVVPYLCASDVTSPPAYDCGACGCIGGDACDDGLCVSRAVREGKRDGDVLSDLLPDDDYFALWRVLAESRARTLAETVVAVDENAVVDPRRIVRIVGADPIDGSDVATRFLRGEAVDPCATTPTSASFVMTTADNVDDTTCLYPGAFARCVLPMPSGCVLRAGLLSERFVVVGRGAYALLDDALLRRVARANREQWLVRMNDLVTAYDTATSWVPNNRFGAPEVRVVDVPTPADLGASLHILWLPSLQPAHHLRSFRALFADPSIQQFIIAENILPSDCTFTVNDDVRVVCTASGGARLTASVSLDHRVVEVEQIPQ